MSVIGLLAEYNPFHSGHQYQIQRIKEEKPTRPLLVLMSGNVVQRGEFACLNKWQRTSLALQHGADLVLELPIFASMQSADTFARIGIEILGQLGVSDLAFGTEEADADELETYVSQLLRAEDQIAALIPDKVGKGLSYAAAYQKSVEEILGESLTFDPTTSNHILAIQYLRAIRQLNLPMNPLAIQRIPGISGSDIRQTMRDKRKVEDLAAPLETLQTLKTQPFTQMEDYYEILNYRLRSMSVEDLRKIFGVREGLEHLMLRIHGASYKEIVDKLISKRWTRSAIQRILLAILLNIPHAAFKEAEENFLHNPCIRILGYNEKGRAYLNKYKNQGSVQLFSNLRKPLVPSYYWTLRVDQVYESNPKHCIAEQNISTFPIYMKNTISNNK